MAFPAKTNGETAAPPRKRKPDYYACETCEAPLVKQWVTRDGGKIRNPEDDTNHCFKCSGLVEVAKLPPAIKKRDWIMVGVLIGIAAAYSPWWLPWLFRAIFK